MRVLAGPFRGMRYIDTSFYSAYIPKLAGLYEKELAMVVETACERRLNPIVDIGAAEGYFAVGFALRNPDAHVIAFEMQEGGRTALNEMITLNDVRERVQVRAKCEPADLQTVLGCAARPLVVCDVEGYELMLLNPAAVPALTNAHILVELHDFIEPGLAETLESRFSGTHRLTRIWQVDRSPDEFPFSTVYTRLLPTSYLAWAVSEWRPERMSWFWMEPIG